MVEHKSPILGCSEPGERGRDGKKQECAHHGPRDLEGTGILLDFALASVFDLVVYVAGIHTQMHSTEHK